MRRRGGQRRPPRTNTVSPPRRRFAAHLGPLRSGVGAKAGGRARESPVRQDLMVLRVSGEDRGVVLNCVVPSLRLDRLVAQVAAHRGRCLNVLLWNALKGLHQILGVGVGALVPRIERVVEDLRDLHVQ
eukprot:scaffold13710_cov122-Isochrysis_galbana.AAC.2